MTKGELTPCPGVHIYGSGPVMEDQRDHMGVYKLTPKMWNGHPVFKKNEGGYYICLLMATGVLLKS